MILSRGIFTLKPKWNLIFEQICLAVFFLISAELFFKKKLKKKIQEKTLFLRKTSWQQKKGHTYYFSQAAATNDGV